MKQQHKTIVLVTLVVLLVAGTLGYAAYQYSSNRKPAPTVSAAQALQERDAAVRTMNLKVAAYKVNVDNLTKQVSDNQEKLASVCTQLKTAKLSNVNCQ